MTTDQKTSAVPPGSSLPIVVSNPDAEPPDEAIEAVAALLLDMVSRRGTVKN